jgi:hypothetical protein
VTVDVDGVVVSTGLQVERAFRGFNPHHRKVPSYYPILAHLAETTHILRVKNRSGNVHDGKASLPFLRDLWAQLARTAAGRAAPLSHGWRVFPPGCAAVAGGAAGGVRDQGAVLSLAGSAAVHSRAADLDPRRPDISGFVVPAVATPWGQPLWVAIYRKKVAHRTAKNFQLDLFDPNDGHYEYSPSPATSR